MVGVGVSGMPAVGYHRRVAPLRVFDHHRFQQQAVAILPPGWNGERSKLVLLHGLEQFLVQYLLPIEFALIEVEHRVACQVYRIAVHHT